MTYGELKVLAYVRIETHDIGILNAFIRPRFTVETDGLGSTAVQGITGTQRTLLYYGMREQFGFLFHNTRLFKIAFPLDLDQITRSRYLLAARHGPLIPFRMRIATRGDDVTERLTRMTLKITSKELVYFSSLGAVNRLQ